MFALSACALTEIERSDEQQSGGESAKTNADK